MTPAQKAAAEILGMADLPSLKSAIAIIQSALDAVKEQCKQQELELAAKWRSDAYIAHPGYSYANGRLMSADELESLAKREK